MNTVYQYYIVEIQQNTAGEYGHIVHWAFDADPDVARRKGEAKFYEVLSAAALSNLPKHSAILFNSDGTPIDHKCYEKNIPAPAAEDVVDGEE